MEKNCRCCRWFPCTKVQCNIGNKEGCEDFESTVSATAKEMKLVSKDGEKYEFEWIKED